MKSESGNHQESFLSLPLDPFTDNCPSANPADVLCGRGRTSFNHVGNKRFRERINATIKDYINAPNRYEKSLVVHGVVEQIQASGGRFLKHDEKTGKWYELSTAQMKEKVGHAIRDAVNALEARVERKRLTDAKEERDTTTSSPVPVASVRDKDSPLNTRCYPANMTENSYVHPQQHFKPHNHPQQNAFDPSQSMVYHHQLSPSDHQRSYPYVPISFQQRYQLHPPRQEEFHHPSCLHEGLYRDHHPNVIEPIPYPPASSPSQITGDIHRAVPSDPIVAAETCPNVEGQGEELRGEGERESSSEKDPFLDQINQVLGPIVDDTEDSCLSI